MADKAALGQRFLSRVLRRSPAKTKIPQPKHARLYVGAPRLNVCNKPSEQIRTYNAEDVYKLLTSHYQKLTLDDHVEIRKHSAAEVAEEREPGPVEDHDGFEVE